MPDLIAGRIPLINGATKPDGPPPTKVAAQPVGAIVLLRITRNGLDHHDAQMDPDVAASVMVQIGAALQGLVGTPHLRHLLLEWIRQIDAQPIG